MGHGNLQRGAKTEVPNMRIRQQLALADKMQNYREPDATGKQPDAGSERRLYFQASAVAASAAEPTKSLAARVERRNLHFAK
jgi:hypothetical protein